MAKNNNPYKLLIATHNSGKQAEFNKLFQGINVQIKTLPDNLKEPIETGNTYSENALQKAIFYYQKVKIPVVAEDSGFEVVSLNNFPGVKSRRWLEDKPYDFKIKQLLKMTKIKSRTACYRSVICFLENSKTYHFFEGTCFGHLVKPVGKNGFGYDRGCLVTHLGKTFAQITPELKNTISHRAIAFQNLRNYFVQNQFISK